MRYLRVLKRSFIHIILAFFALIIGYPFLWMVSMSLKSEREFYANPWGLPAKLALQNYVEAWRLGQIGVYFVNSVLVTLFTVLIISLLASMAAYAFARLKFPGSTFLFYSFLASLIVPPQVTIVPLYMVFRDLHLLNTRLGLILAYSAGGLAFSIFLLRAFFLSLPKAIEDAASVDGCSRFGAFFRIILPISKPALATVVIFQGMGAWNEFFIALLLIRDAALRTIPLGLYIFFSQRVIEWSYVFAFLTIATIPVIVVYIILQRQFISGLMAGSLKG